LTYWFSVVGIFYYLSGLNPFGDTNMLISPAAVQTTNDWIEFARRMLRPINASTREWIHCDFSVNINTFIIIVTCTNHNIYAYNYEVHTVLRPDSKNTDIKTVSGVTTCKPLNVSNIPNNRPSNFCIGLLFL